MPKLWLREKLCSLRSVYAFVAHLATESMLHVSNIFTCVAAPLLNMISCVHALHSLCHILGRQLDTLKLPSNPLDTLIDGLGGPGQSKVLDLLLMY